jgi:2-(1,2-epoxy-1,2-dihydrophenyl)acetyl-CoA isomerase
MADEKPLEEQVANRVENGVSWIVLNRPEVRNAITPDQRNRVIDLLQNAGESYDVRAVVITATGEGFCTGADLRAQRTAPSRPEGAPERIVGMGARTIMEGAQRLVAAILDCPKPVVSAVNGTAAGIGVHIALASDLVIAAEGVRFIEVFVRRGIIPDGGGIYLLPRIVGLQKAKEIVFFGDDIPAERALEMGLVNKVVPKDELEAAAKDWAERLAQGPTMTLGFAKWMLNRSFDVDRRTSLDEEAWAQEIVTTTQDSAEGMRSFIERRKPEFKGF